MPIHPVNNASYYRRLAQQSRDLAKQISIKSAKEKLLEYARQSESLAEEEDRRTGQSRQSGASMFPVARDP